MTEIIKINQKVEFYSQPTETQFSLPIGSKETRHVMVARVFWRGHMRQAALGFRAHSGWTALVAIALEEGSPRVLLRERPHLVKTFTYEFRQPYHTAKLKPPADAPDFISRIRTEAQNLACQAITSVQTGLQRRSYQLKFCGLLLASGKPLPALPQILASHAMIHTADGELFREALLDAAARCGLETFTAKESELLDRASQELQLHPDQLKQRLTSLGAALGSPWAQDEKLAALVAWLSLASPVSDVARVRPE